MRGQNLFEYLVVSHSAKLCGWRSGLSIIQPTYNDSFKYMSDDVVDRIDF